MAHAQIAEAFRDSREGRLWDEAADDLYGGPEGRLWELVAGEMLHCGGIGQTTAMVKRPGSQRATRFSIYAGIWNELALPRQEIRNRGSWARHQPLYGRASDQRSEPKDLRVITYQQGSVYQVPWTTIVSMSSGARTRGAIWSAKEDLIKEAVRVLKPGGVIAFSDWMTGPSGLSAEEAERIHGFMKFPYTESLKSYEGLLKKYAMRIKSSEDLCEQFANSMDLYLRMIREQLTYDALRILGDNSEAARSDLRRVEVHDRDGSQREIRSRAHRSRKGLMTYGDCVDAECWTAHCGDRPGAQCRMPACNKSRASALIGERLVFAPVTRGRNDNVER